MALKNRNMLLASLKSEDFSLLSRYLREVPIEQGALLEDRGERVDAVHFPQTGMISLIVEMPEDGSVEVGIVGREGGVGLAVGLGSRIASVSALVHGPLFYTTQHIRYRFQTLLRFFDFLLDPRNLLNGRQAGHLRKLYLYF